MVVVMLLQLYFKLNAFSKNFVNNFQSGWATQGLGVLPAQSYDGHCGK